MQRLNDGFKEYLVQGKHLQYVNFIKNQDIQYKRLTNRYTIFLGYNEYLVTYTNLGSVSVKKGDVVKKDQVIGTIGNGIDANDKPFIRLAIYDCDSKKALYVSDFFKKL